MWALGAVGIEETTTGLRIAFAQRELAVAAREAFDPTAPIETVDDAVGLDSGRDLLDVVLAGPFAVHPPWLDPPADSVALVVDPGHAFGSGSHPSTRLALTLIGDHVRAGDRVIDLGCGSGVLSLAAALVGATVTAVDIDPAAIQATEANARANGVAHAITALVGSGSRAAAVEPAPDWIVANLTVDLHETVAPPLVPAAGAVIVAGVLVGPQSARAAVAWQRRIAVERTEGEWAGLVLRRAGQ
ncbi:MAG: 50S ribosomal protein L11 methyltransferase [Acidimicrobiales bacterium]